MRDAVVAVYEARKNLALTLKDTRTVVGKLENILAVGLHGVCFLFYLSIFNVSGMSAAACGACCITHACMYE